MHESLFICLALIFSASILVLIARRLSVPYPIFLVMAGLAMSFVPGVPKIQIDPDIVFLIILPPVLFDAAQNTSWKALWKWRRIVSFMALGYVMLTATVVAFAACWLIPGFSLPHGFLLGAIISPPDAAAATTILKKIRLPKSLVAILEGESLLNDASSLTVYRFALTAIISHHFEWPQAVGNFLLISSSGIAIGFVFGLLFYAIYKWLPTTANLNIALSFVLPYIIYLTAEAFQSFRSPGGGHGRSLHRLSDSSHLLAQQPPALECGMAGHNFCTQRGYFFPDRLTIALCYRRNSKYHLGDSDRPVDHYYCYCDQIGGGLHFFPFHGIYQSISIGFGKSRRMAKSPDHQLGRNAGCRIASFGTCHTFIPYGRSAVSISPPHIIHHFHRNHRHPGRTRTGFTLDNQFLKTGESALHKRG